MSSSIDRSVYAQAHLVDRWYWYFALLVLAFVAGMLHLRLSGSVTNHRLGLIVCIKGETSLPWWSYIVSLAVGAFITVRACLLVVVARLLTVLSAFLNYTVRAHGQWYR